MRLEELNWMDVEAYRKQDDRILIVLGACEQHGYLSLLTDTKIPLALADAASTQTGVLIAPPLPFGISPYFLSYPGTISLRMETLAAVVTDMVHSLYQHGFRRMLFLNGHGGNQPIVARLYELTNQLAGLQTAWYSWWSSESVSRVAESHGLKIYHAGWGEAFPFVQVCELPEGEKIPPNFKGLPNATETRHLYGDGVFGGAYRPDPVILDEVFNAALQDILFLLKF